MDKKTLAKYGITGVKEILYNPTYEVLYNEETKPGLEGFDKEPIHTRRNEHSARYNNLRPGRYRFVVSAYCGDEYEVYSRALDIRIKRAPLASIPAIIFYALMLAAGFAAFFKVYRERAEALRRREIAEHDKARAEELNVAKLQFFTNITHDLMTPLSIIVANAEDLKTQAPYRKEYDSITDNALRLMRLIQQILEFRKAESGNLRLKVSRGNITSYLQNCGMSIDRMTIEGRSFREPIADNSTVEGRLQNRRVEIYLTANEKMIQDAQAGTLD